MIEKMTTKVLIFGLLYNVMCTGANQVIIQANPFWAENPEAKSEAFPTYDLLPKCATLHCASVINKKKEKLQQLDNFLRNHIEIIENPNLNPAVKFHLKTEFDKVKLLRDLSMAKLNSDLDEFCHTPDAEARRHWCTEKLKVHRKVFKNIIMQTTKFKSSIEAIRGIPEIHYLPYDTNDISQD